MTTRFINIVSEFSPIGHGQSLEQIVNYGERYLKNICSPHPEGFMHWNNLRDIMLESSTLIEFHAWGVFSELLADKLAIEYESGNHSIKLTDPNFGLDMINELVDDEYQFIDLSYFNYNPDIDL
ncbi:hypothetical protein MHO82_25405 [Vibrio sp. Of7-15]|uniref:hypothetical protein n=1 Tax=Vibrio sp. Of7-15 TaxID=2724879 RepID=UPI001EF1EC1A|nr:hypothetical protein [Vibrio sp. Of7-15]MCG7500193.1 hypothetical protein [Vibrio sp. Of7-15]